LARAGVKLLRQYLKRVSAQRIVLGIHPRHFAILVGADGALRVNRSASNDAIIDACRYFARL
jgi:hypothetical protein